MTVLEMDPSLRAAPPFVPSCAFNPAISPLFPLRLNYRVYSLCASTSSICCYRRLIHISQHQLSTRLWPTSAAWFLLRTNAAHTWDWTVSSIRTHYHRFLTRKKSSPKQRPPFERAHDLHIPSHKGQNDTEHPRQRVIWSRQELDLGN